VIFGTPHPTVPRTEGGGVDPTITPLNTSLCWLVGYIGNESFSSGKGLRDLEPGLLYSTTGQDIKLYRGDAETATDGRRVPPEKQLCTDP